MKKNFISTVALLLCGAIFFGSCEDMLEPDSNRVEYDYNDWTFNDSVYSVLGILNAVQKVGDRQVLLGELRGDLVTINNNTLDDVKEISNFEFDADNNEYLDVKDYYAIINNCNLFLARVDTTLSYDNQNLMLREYVAVKSVRAWTYMQLIKNYAYIPFFTDPVLTNSEAVEVLANSSADQMTVINYLIEDIARYENPSGKYHMPYWEIPGYATAGMTAKLFMPIRVLLGDLYLWRASLKAETASYPSLVGNPNSDYAKAAEYYYKYLTIDNPSTDIVDVSSHNSDKDSRENPTYYPGKGFAARFDQKNFTNKMNNFVAAIRYSNTEIEGTTSNLAAIFSPVDVAGKNQVEAAPAMRAISDRQTYLLRSGNENDYDYEYIKSTNFPGDLRLYSVVASQRGDDLNKTLHNNMIIKFNYHSESGRITTEGSTMLYTARTNTRDIMLDRPEYIYLRFAEALLGLAREGYAGAKELAMTVLKSGIKGNCEIYWQPDTVDEYMVDEATGEYIMEPLLDEKGKEVYLEFVEEATDEEGNPLLDEEGNPVTTTTKVTQYAPVYKTVVKTENGVIAYDFSDSRFYNNRGIHSRGSGFTEKNSKYALSDSCVAAHFGKDQNPEHTTVRVPVIKNGKWQQLPVMDENKEYVLDENGNVTWEFVYEDKDTVLYDVTDEERLLFMYDKLIDEMALETAFEGNRFSDLSRLATALGNPEFFARRVAAREVLTGDWRTAEGAEGWNGELYGRLLDKNNWYLPLPDNYLDFDIVPVPPTDPVLPEEDDTTGDDVVEGGDIVEGGDDIVEGGDVVVEGEVETTNP